MMVLDQSDSPLLDWDKDRDQHPLKRMVMEENIYLKNEILLENIRRNICFPLLMFSSHVVSRNAINKKLLGPLYPQIHSTQVDRKGKGMMSVTDNLGG